MPIEPIVLAANQPRRFYRGGARIADFRGSSQEFPNTPEDFIASVVETGKGDGDGLSRLGDGALLRDLIDADPDAFFGPAHVAAYGSDICVLVKMLDTGERLLTHFHPSAEFAARHLGCAHGKSEAWIITEVTDTPGDETSGFVYYGFADEVGADVVAGWVAGQDRAAIVGGLNQFAVEPGDVFFVPAGVPHGIGAGVTMMELQEPTDFSIMLEWAGFDYDGSAEGHLNLGFDLALQALDRSAWTPGRVAAIRSHVDIPAPAAEPTVAQVLTGTAETFFRAAWVTAGAAAEYPAEFAVLVVFGGEGALETAAGTVPLRRGSTVLVPYDAGPSRLTGRLVALRCRPPAPTAATPGG
jgi:mannose-6-phosphate isomerase